ncbi:MAG: hypothetical protein KJP01_06160 [Gramella sp.]|nr:hypothetical protein [Eudoraea sp.]MBT8319698.1 hypothetical protein [Christiangramia sp.]
MRIQEIIETGSFETWESSKIRELKQQQYQEGLGQNILFENDLILVSELVLYPGERLPFRKLNRNFTLVSMTDGLAISRSGCGNVSLIVIAKGDQRFCNFEGKNVLKDLENIGERMLFFYIMEYKAIGEICNTN